MNLLANPQKAFVLENTAKVNKDKKDIGKNVSNSTNYVSCNIFDRS